MNSKRAIAVGIALLALAGGPTAAATLSPNATISAGYCAINAAQAGKIASKKFGGKVIDVKKVQYKGQAAFRVKLLQNSGRIHSVFINAANGRPMG